MNINRTAQDPYVAASPQLRAWWDAADDGRFLVPRCLDCGRVHWYPRAHCPLCGSIAVRLVDASGRATLHSFSVIHRAAKPYVLAYVQIEEGPLLMTNIVNCPFDALRIDMPLQARFRRTAYGRNAVVFSPA